MKKEFIEKLLQIGYNCMPINPDKTPFAKWSDYKTEKIQSLSQFPKESDYYAMITGFNNVECIDVDLKVITDYAYRKKFKKDLFDLLNDNVEDFYKKVVIKKTRSEGYHIIYRVNIVTMENFDKHLKVGNNKLAKINGYKEAVIETRGVGGYICMYEDVYLERDYHNIQLISEEDREIIISCCKTFHDEHTQPIEPIPTKIHKEFSESETTPWSDYNEKTKVWDLISNEFQIVKNTTDKILIRRNGASSPHSGYIFQKTGFLYLFSTGTRYPAEKLLTPFIIYAIQKHNENYSAAASDLYSKGFGIRKKPQLKQNIINESAKQIKSAKIDFPIEIFPKDIQSFIFDSAKTLNMSIDYMGCSFLWLGSLIIGNSFVFEVKRGWQEICSIWIAIVGEAGIGKSPSIGQMIRPLFKENSKRIKQYQKQKKDFDEYNKLSKKEKETVIEVEEPVREQFIVDDVTIEALINLHAQSKNGVGVFKDELAGWFKDMNKYKEGSDKEQWLSSWSGKGIQVDRITRQSDYIDSPFLPVIGGIQPTILAGFFTDENKDNGFLDRMLFCYPNLKVEEYVDSEIAIELINFYSDWVLNLKSCISNVRVINENGEIESTICRFNADSKKLWINYFNKITAMQNSDTTQEFLKSMLAKQKSYIPRFALILNILNYETVKDSVSISIESIKGAYLLSKYFIKNYEKLIQINTEIADTNKTLKETKGNNFEKLKVIFEQNPDFNRSEIAKRFNISRQMLYKYISQLQKTDEKSVN